MNKEMKRPISNNEESLTKKPEDYLGSSREDRKDLGQLGRILRERRKSLGITIRAVAKRAEIGPTYVWVLRTWDEPVYWKSIKAINKSA